MSTITSSPDCITVTTQFAQVIAAWIENSKLTIPGVALNDAQTVFEDFKKSIDTAEQAKLAREQAIQERNDLKNKAWNLTKKIRNKAKATFGDNSSVVDGFITKG